MGLFVVNLGVLLRDTEYKFLQLCCCLKLISLVSSFIPTQFPCFTWFFLFHFPPLHAALLHQKETRVVHTEGVLLPNPSSFSHCSSSENRFTLKKLCQFKVLLPGCRYVDLPYLIFNFFF